MNVLVINNGSSSLKYQVIEFPSENILLKKKVERIKEGNLQQVLKDELNNLNANEIDLICHRVVHGGVFFDAPTKIDQSVLVKIEKCIPLAPLHNPANLLGVKACLEIFPDLTQVAVFDTAFHRTMPAWAKTYGIPKDLAEKHNIYRFGFHGPSHRYVASELAKSLSRPLAELKVISCHLGNGASVCAIEYGHSVETSMGMTPLEGLVMGTRCGDVDPSIIVKIAKEENLSLEQVEQLLNKESGLKGLSQISNDLRDIEEQAIQGNESAILAIQVFCHRVRKYIGSYLSVMNGADAIIFTGGIGENSASIRQRIMQNLNYVGLLIDENQNTHVQFDNHQNVHELTSRNSRLKAFIVKTNEELMMAREALSVYQEKEKVNNPKTIPIAISARHAHLTKETFETLFGKGSELTKLKDISQPGQYASIHKINLIGPKGRIDGVRILGPLRPKNQIEISRTDEFTLGIDAPIRRSGKVTGSAPITIEGPEGTVSLPEGLICAWRHIHMQPQDAKDFDVEDGDEVEVSISGGPRDLTFSDVLVRVKDSYILEMHIDTDEANAAELSQGDPGELVYNHGPAEVTAKLNRRHNS